MSKYIPDAWVLVEINSKEYGKIRKILAGWYGGYCGSDEWKLSSGNLAEYTENGFIVFPQESGSFYYCHPDCQRMTGLMGSIFNRFVTQFKEVGASIEIIEYK